jgi:hypothetical protein
MFKIFKKFHKESTNPMTAEELRNLHNQIDQSLDRLTKQIDGRITDLSDYKEALLVSSSLIVMKEINAIQTRLSNIYKLNN